MTDEVIELTNRRKLNATGGAPATGSETRFAQSVPIAIDSPRLARSSSVAVFSHALPPGHPLTLGGAKRDCPSAPSELTSICCGSE